MVTSGEEWTWDGGLNIFGCMLTNFLGKAFFGLGTRDFHCWVLTGFFSCLFVEKGFWEKVLFLLWGFRVLGELVFGPELLEYLCCFQTSGFGFVK